MYSNAKNKESKIKFARVSPKPKDLVVTKTTRPLQIRRYYKNLFKHKLFLKRLGLKEIDSENKRYCSEHETEAVIEKKKINVKGVEEMVEFCNFANNLFLQKVINDSQETRLWCLHLLLLIARGTRGQ